MIIILGIVCFFSIFFEIRNLKGRYGPNVSYLFSLPIIILLYLQSEPLEGTIKIVLVISTVIVLAILKFIKFNYNKE